MRFTLTLLATLAFTPFFILISLSLLSIISYRLPRVSDLIGLGEREGMDEGVREAVRFNVDCEIDFACELCLNCNKKRKDHEQAKSE